MLEIIRFDKRCAGWTRDSEANRGYLKHQVEYLKEKLRYKRYMYLHEIYETFGAEWKPEEYKNICYLAEFGELHIDIEPSEEQNCYLIKIYQD